MDGMNLSDWKDDRNGCGNKRTAMIDTLRNQRLKLQGLSEMQIVDLLGRPDKTELYDRNQKLYHYYLIPGVACGKDSANLRLSVRFNAVGLSREITIE